MAWIAGHVVERDGNAVLVGTEDAFTLLRFEPAVVHYVIGDTAYQDAIAPRVAATVWQSSPTQSQIDTVHSQYVSFIQPQLGGAASVYLIPERLYGQLITLTDVIPLDLITMRQVIYFQPPYPGSLPLRPGALFIYIRHISQLTYLWGRVRIPTSTIPNTAILSRVFAHVKALSTTITNTALASITGGSFVGGAQMGTFDSESFVGGAQMGTFDSESFVGGAVS